MDLGKVVAQTEAAKSSSLQNDMLSIWRDKLYAFNMLAYIKSRRCSYTLTWRYICCLSYIKPFVNKIFGSLCDPLSVYKSFFFQIVIPLRISWEINSVSQVRFDDFFFLFVLWHRLSVNIWKSAEIEKLNIYHKNMALTFWQWFWSATFLLYIILRNMNGKIFSNPNNWCIIVKKKTLI